LTHQRERHGLVNVLPLAAHVRVLLGEQRARLVAARAARLLARESWLGLVQWFLSRARVTRGLHLLTRRRDKTPVQANSTPGLTTGLTTGQRQWMTGSRGARETRVPSVGLATPQHGLERCGNAATGRDQRPAIRPSLARTKKPLSSRAPVPAAWSV